jgi:hypothetical protein
VTSFTTGVNPKKVAKPTVSTTAFAQYMNPSDPLLGSNPTAFINSCLIDVNQQYPSMGVSQRVGTRSIPNPDSMPRAASSPTTYSMYYSDLVVDSTTVVAQAYTIHKHEPLPSGDCHTEVVSTNLNILIDEDDMCAFDQIANDDDKNILLGEYPAVVVPPNVSVMGPSGPSTYTVSDPSRAQRSFYVSSTLSMVGDNSVRLGSLKSGRMTSTLASSNIEMTKADDIIPLTTVTKIGGTVYSSDKKRTYQQADGGTHSSSSKKRDRGAETEEMETGEGDDEIFAEEPLPFDEDMRIGKFSKYLDAGVGLEDLNNDPLKSFLFSRTDFDLPDNLLNLFDPLDIDPEDEHILEWMAFNEKK